MSSGRLSWSMLAMAVLVGGCAEQPLPAPEAPRATPASATRGAGDALGPAPATAREDAPGEHQEPPPMVRDQAPVAIACDARKGPDGLRRAAVLRTLDGGLGNWLRTVDVDPKLDHGHFRGWIIRTLPEGNACYSDLDLHAGDVVTRVNGRPVERPEEASQVWDGLRTSTALVIDFVRAGQPRTLRFKIVEP